MTLGYADLEPYQQDGVSKILTQPNLYLGDDPGLGKTAQVIVACSRLPKRILEKGVLIICPASLRLNWDLEWIKWGGPTNCEVRIMSYNEATKDALGEEPKKGIANIGIKKREWGVVAIDEAHALKSTKSKRGRHLLFNIWKEGEAFVRSEGLKAERMVLMSGTPVLNNPKDVFPLIRHLDRKAWPSKTKFESRYCDGHVDKYGRWNTDGASNLSELKDKLVGSGLLLRRLKKDVLKQLPPKRRQVIPLTGKVGETKRINSILVDAVGQAPKLENTEEDMKWAVKALGEMQAELGGHVAEVRRLLGDAKIKPTLDLIKEQLELGVLPHKLVIFAHHRGVIESLVEGLNKMGVSASAYYGGMNDTQKNQVVQDFQTGSLRVFVGSIVAAGVGLTLTSADTAMVVEPSYVPAENVQAEDRIHRIGTQNNVLIQYLVLANSLDNRILNLVVDKMEMISEILS